MLAAADEVLVGVDRAIAGVYDEVSRFVCLVRYPVDSRLVGKRIFRFHTVVIQFHIERIRSNVLVVIVVRYDRTQLFSLIGTEIECGTFPVIGDNQWKPLQQFGGVVGAFRVNTKHTVG